MIRVSLNFFKPVINFIRRNLVVCSSIFLLLAAMIIIAIILVSHSPKKPTGTDIVSSSVPQLVSPQNDSSRNVSSEKPPEKLLEIVTPSSESSDTTEPSFTFAGSSDPQKPLYFNEKEVIRDENGNFLINVVLTVGINKFVFSNKDRTVKYTVNYRYVVIQSYDPKSSQSFGSGSVLAVNVLARAKSTVTATLGDETITLTRVIKQGDDEDDNENSDVFVDYSGSFSLPSGNISDLSLGKILFTASCNGETENYYSGTITVKKDSNVKLVATILVDRAETFNGNSTDDLSRPTNNYLPLETVDYCDEGTVKNGTNTYIRMRCGRRVYTASNPGKLYSKQVVKTEVGKLPDHNEILIESFDQTEKYTTLKLGCLWKAPFLLDVLKQSYNNEVKQDYAFTSATFSYVDITFCYATVFKGTLDLPENNPIFKSAEVINNGSSFILRLMLKKTGGFYGWDAYYDSEGYLVFDFLNPYIMQNEDSLSGAKIYIDVGHGGTDGGASVFDYNNNEAVRNLILANKLKSKLELFGATVVLNRTDNSTYISPPDRMKKLRDAHADFCIAIHHDSNNKNTMSGFGAYHFTPYSKTAADFIDKAVDKTNIFSQDWNVRSHYYYVARVSNCPVVLTENGFMSNQSDFNNILDDEFNNRKAHALAEGIMDYFKSIQQHV